jgi:hypothetical protein
MKKITVRYFVPTKKSLTEGLQRWVTASECFDNILRKYIRDRQSELDEENTTILRAKMRIEKITKAKSIAEEVLKETNNQQIRKIRAMTERWKSINKEQK